MKIKILKILFILFTLFIAPQIILTIYYKSHIYGEIHQIPQHTYGVVLGAYVKKDFTLTDAAYERVEAAVQLYQHNKISKLFVSGDNSSHKEVEMISQYAIKQSVPMTDIVMDKKGIDTHDTCIHFSGVSGKGVLVSQAFHLPRAMYMCEREGVEVVGLAANRLNILTKRGDTVFSIYLTRMQRFFKECFLTWLFLLGLYDMVSDSFS